MDILEIEERALSCAMVSSKDADYIIGELEAEHFDDLKFRNIFIAIKELRDKKEPTDMGIISHQLKSKGLPGLAGRMASIIILDGHSMHRKFYVEKLLKRRKEVEIKEATLKLHNSSYDDEAMDKLTVLFNDKKSISSNGSASIESDMHMTLEKLERPRGDCFLTGIKKLDSATGGLMPGHLFTLGARTGVGKSALLLQISLNMAENGDKVAMFSTEMDSYQVFKRALAMRSSVPARSVREGMDKFYWDEIVKTAASLAKFPFMVSDKPRPSIADIQSFIQQHSPKVVVVDYLQRCSLPKAESMRLQVSGFMTAIKTLASDNNVLIILASQLNRESVKAPGMPPSLASLRESSSVEEESDYVALLWDAGDPDFRIGKKDSKDYEYEDSGFRQIMLAKNRHGSCGRVETKFDHNSLSFSEVYG